jgi:putative PEP-CTERM system histidine kinase
LILSNAARHRGNVAFQDDMIQTVRQSVDKLNRMLRQLQAKSTDLETERIVELGPLLRQVVAEQAQLQHSISLDLKAAAVKVKADEERLKAIVDHLVQNALEAVGEDGRVEVRLSETGEMIALEIEDNGPGMDADFVRDHLFRPFDSTKSSGYGIGAYESQEYARSLGGRIEVISRPGYGTIMRMCLPRLAAE